jgi:hypothetical protein
MVDITLGLEALISSNEKSLSNNSEHSLQIKGFPEFNVKRSETWKFKPDPWYIQSNDGTLLFKYDDMTFTKYEFEDKVFITFSSFDTPQGWDCRTENNQHTLLRTQMLIKNEAGAVIDNIILGKEVLCSTPAITSTFTKNYSIDWYDLIQGVTLHQLESWWRQC